MGGLANPRQVAVSIRRKLRGVFLHEDPGKAVNVAQGRAKVMRNGICKSFELAIRCLQVLGPPAEVLLHRDAVGDIANGTGHQQLSLDFQRAETNFDGKFGSVAPEAAKGHARAHGPGAGSRSIVGAMMRMGIAKTGRHEHLHGLTQQLGRAIAEEKFGLAVDKDNLPARIGDHDGVGRRFDQFAGFLFCAGRSSGLAPVEKT